MPVPNTRSAEVYDLVVTNGPLSPEDVWELRGGQDPITTLQCCMHGMASPTGVLRVIGKKWEARWVRGDRASKDDAYWRSANVYGLSSREYDYPALGPKPKARPVPRQPYAPIEPSRSDEHGQRVYRVKPGDVRIPRRADVELIVAYAWGAGELRADGTRKGSRRRAPA